MNKNIAHNMNYESFCDIEGQGRSRPFEV